MSKFKVGDKVRVRADADGYFIEDSMKTMRGKTVTIALDDGSNRMQYRINEMHYWWDESLFESIEPRREFIVIRRDDQDVIASHKRGDRIVKTAKASCNPSDEFKFETGAELAFDRLMGREESKPAHRFKVGDRVEELLVGYGIGKILEVDREDKKTPYKVKFDCDFVWLPERRLSPAPAPEPPKFYTGKVVCYGCDAGAELAYGDLIGKIGIIENGHATWRTGLANEGYKSFEDFCSKNYKGRWIEIKE